MVKREEIEARTEELVQPLVAKKQFELVDVEYVKEGGSYYLRIYIDKEEGVSLDDCEIYHRAIQPQLESYDYDFLEISSPGIDRPLKKDRDFERAAGSEIEVRLFKAVDGQKVVSGILVGLEGDEIVLMLPEGEKRIPRKAAALVKPVVDMEGIESVDLSE